MLVLHVQCYVVVIVQSLSRVWLFVTPLFVACCSTPGFPSLSPRVCSNSRPMSWWCHPTISSSVILFSSCLRSFPASRSFPTSQLFASGGHSIGASALASVPPMNIQDWFPLGFTDLISLQSKGLSRVFLSYNNKRWNLSTCPSIGKFINKIYLYYGFTVQKVIESTGLGRSQKANAKKSKLKEDVMIAL